MKLWTENTHIGLLLAYITACQFCRVPERGSCHGSFTAQTAVTGASLHRQLSRELHCTDSCHGSFAAQTAVTGASLHRKLSSELHCTDRCHGCFTAQTACIRFEFTFRFYRAFQLTSFHRRVSNGAKFFFGCLVPVR
jgi:hypothetical protein